MYSHLKYILNEYIKIDIILKIIKIDFNLLKIEANVFTSNYFATMQKLLCATMHSQLVLSLFSPNDAYLTSCNGEKNEYPNENSFRKKLECLSNGKKRSK